jgi:NTE family protein
MSAIRILFLICAGIAAAQAAPLSAPDPAPARPRVALVLSGGGARGFAHIGVLRVLRELKVPLDIVVGTSMGSVVGGAFAAGSSVEALEQIVRTTDWDSVVADRPARDALSFRRREDDLLLPSRIEFGVTRAGLRLPPAAAGNSALEFALARLLPAGTRDRPVDQLALPFRSVASDLVSGELVELVDTPLFLTMRASLAVPGVFAPVRVRQRLLVDGGLVRNLAIDLARAMGAEIVIAVNVGTPLAGEAELGTAVGVAQQMLRILTEQNVQRSLKELAAADILIAPDLAGIDFLDFGAHERAMAVGAAAARLSTGRLALLSVGDDAYAALEQKRLAAPQTADPALPLDRIEVSGTPHIPAQALLAQSALREGESVTLEQIHQAQSRLYGRGDLERVEIEVDDQAGRRSAVIKATEADWARSRLRFGLELGSDFADSNVFNLGVMHVASSLNAWGAELRTVARIGSQRQFGMQWWQPLGPGSDWYIEPAILYGGTAADIFSNGRKRVRVDFRSAGASLALGHQFGDWGDVQWGISRQFAHVRALIPDDGSQAPIQTFDTSEYVQLRVDSLDSLAFPVRGQLLNAIWERSLANRPGESSLARSQVTGMTAFGVGDWAGHVYGEWARAQVGFAPLTLGGFLRLSGTPANSVDGRAVVLGRLVMARRIGTMPITLGGMARVGFSAEIGGGFGTDESIRTSAMRRAGSAFLSVDTRFGPIYLGAGATRHSGSSLYLFLGPIWQ